jgi:CO/xanthine dehydrogenase FAD-binding subunit
MEALTMKPSPFELMRPTSLGEALEFRANDQRHTVVLAGGQSLMPLMNLRLSMPEVVVDINGVSELDRLELTDSEVRVGAICRQHTVESSAQVRRALPILPALVRRIGHRTIRNRGTVCGSLAHADPAAELPALATAVDAGLVARSLRGVRAIPAADFFNGYLSTALEADEILIESRWPRRFACAVFGHADFTRRAGDFALAAVLVVALPGSGPAGVSDVRVVAYGSVPRPIRLREVEGILTDGPWDDALVEFASRALRDGVMPTGDIHGSVDYKRHLFGVMCTRAIHRARVHIEEGAFL